MVRWRPAERRDLHRGRTGYHLGLLGSCDIEAVPEPSGQLLQGSAICVVMVGGRVVQNRCS